MKLSLLQFTVGSNFDENFEKSTKTSKANRGKRYLQGTAIMYRKASFAAWGLSQCCVYGWKEARAEKSILSHLFAFFWLSSPIAHIFVFFAIRFFIQFRSGADPFVVCSGSVRGPFGSVQGRSGFVWGPFGIRSGSVGRQH